MTITNIITLIIAFLQLSLSLNVTIASTKIEKITRYKDDQLPKKIFIYIFFFGFLTLLFKKRICEYRKDYDLYQDYRYLKSMGYHNAKYLDEKEKADYKRLDRYFKLKHLKAKNGK